MYFATDSTWNQTAVFFSLVFAGMVLALVFVLFESEKQYIKKKFFKNIHDVVFCIIMFLVVGITLYMVDNGKLEIYMVPALLIGFFTGKFLFEETVKNAMNKVNTLVNLLKKRLNNKAK